MPFLLSTFRALIPSLFMLTASAATASPDPAIEKIRSELTKQLGDISLDSIEVSPVPGLYEVLIGARLYYVSADGRYFIRGQMTDIGTGQNLTEAKVAKARKKLIDDVGEDNMIVFGKGDEKHTISVFTDIDCGYCRKLHAEMDEYNKNGIRVRYLFYPRAGMNSDSGRKTVSVWCADDRKKALSEAKQGKDPKPESCANPIADQYALGQVVGVTGTPALVLENGELLPGYVPPTRLRQILDAKLVEK
ncbi:MAG TPA: bifunctional protein-disulfide isomerase/oxidoreductase DsbC [Chromatiaceae bacterium]|nr:bifunctional protein-disulfide isomerase/oxidoreductase DsbC [Chromatiaceae bacterium]